MPPPPPASFFKRLITSSVVCLETDGIRFYVFQSVKRVIGVEIIENAVEDAKANAQLNGEFWAKILEWAIRTPPPPPLLRIGVSSLPPKKAIKNSSTPKDFVGNRFTPQD